jgi:hypothetical protein
MNEILPVAQITQRITEKVQQPFRATTDLDVDDKYFIATLRTLTELRYFLTQEAVRIPPEEVSSTSLSTLSQLRFHGRGRRPTAEEWLGLETNTERLFAALSEPLRRKFLVGRISWWRSGLPIAFVLLALLSLIVTIYFGYARLSYGSSQPEGILGATIFPFYLAWLASLGAMGSIAFVGMNALSVQQDITFDLSNTRLITLRVALGALFGIVLTLPFAGFDAFLRFSYGILLTNLYVAAPTDTATAINVQAQTLLLLLPFVLGFSTPLVILVLNRFVDAVQIFFGKTSAARETSVADGGLTTKTK